VGDDNLHADLIADVETDTNPKTDKAEPDVDGQTAEIKVSTNDSIVNPSISET
jgi:hypothetical protein